MSSPFRSLALAALAVIPILPAGARAQGTAESFALPNNAASSLPMGTTKGERYKRLIVRGATVLSGRGTPGTNRAMPPEGPVDIVIENGVIVDMIPMDPVNAAGYGRGVQRATGDKIIDARGMYIMPGLVEMHAHLPPPGNDLGPRGLDYAYRLYLGHGITTVRDAGSGAGIELLARQRAMVPIRLSTPGTIVQVMHPDGERRSTVVPMPFIDPKKEIPKA